MPPVPRRKLAALTAAAVLALGGSAAIVVPKIQHSKEAGAREQRRIQAARDRAERRRLAADQTPHRGRAERAVGRIALVQALERAITRDARQRARRGKLDGPIMGTSCERLHVGSEERLARVLGRYSCMAITGTNRSVPGYPFDTGYPFIATVHFATRSYVWCKLNLRPGEGARGEAVAVKLSRSCAGPYRELL